MNLLPLFSFSILLLIEASPLGSEEGLGGIDLLGELQLHNTSREGVTLTPGPFRLRPAFNLQGSYRELRVPEPTYRQAVELLQQSREFTLAASVRQELYNSGSVIAFSHGVNRYLELQSSGRKDEVRLHYTSSIDSAVHVETFPYRLADRSWHKIALSVSGSQVQLIIDCHPLYKRLLLRPLDTNFTQPQLSLWVGQRNNRHSLFKGALQDVRIIRGANGYLNQCPHLDSSCPTCGQFSALQDTVEQLTQHLHQLSARLLAAENRIAKVEECECQKSCSLNGSVYADGASWQNGCEKCSCVHGEIECKPVQCPKLNCKKPVLNPGECCPTCLKRCYMKGTLHDHGDLVSLKHCVECKCQDGYMRCTRIDPDTMCPPLSCPPNLQFSVPDECCKFCPGVDYCSKGHSCHTNASCNNLVTTYACHCDPGYTGDGKVCTDVNECLSEGGPEGHHCRSNTRCANIPGGYECQCLPGHRRVDRFSCAEIDECATNQHNCHKDANCINTEGSYRCECAHGYTGDGITCSPVCEEPCLNGGTCIDGGICHCRAGYHGKFCQLDVDECKEGLHSCGNSSRCVNMPGWYYCTCADGYTSSLSYQDSLVPICQDIDECENGNHTCHPSAQCINTDGGFKCSCDFNPSNNSDCKLNCMLKIGEEVENDKTFLLPDSPCTECVCSNGVLTCSQKTCDCSSPLSQSDSKCCPHCDPRASCTHQELPHVTFRSGERWIYQCQTCECLLGEIDCWSIECAPVWCKSTVLSTTECCPRCADDPCSQPTSNVTTGLAMRPCHSALSSAGRLYQIQPPRWAHHCASCNCKDGHLCCDANVDCRSANESSTKPLEIEFNNQPTQTNSSSVHLLDIQLLANTSTSNGSLNSS